MKSFNYRTVFITDAPMFKYFRSIGKEKEFMDAFIGWIEYDPSTGEVPEELKDNPMFEFFKDRVDQTYKAWLTKQNNGQRGGEARARNRAAKGAETKNIISDEMKDFDYLNTHFNREEIIANYPFSALFLNSDRFAPHYDKIKDIDNVTKWFEGKTA